MPLRAMPSGADPPHRATQILSTARAPDGRGCTAYGTGLAVGGGLVLTAAHVLLAPADLRAACGFARAVPVRVDVTFAAGAHIARVLAQGRRIDAPRMHFAAAGDYAVLRVDVPMHSAPLQACAGSAYPGEEVRIVTRAGVVTAAVAATQSATGEDAGYVDLDRLVANGDSGAGVLDARAGCVLGLISHRFPEPRPQVTRMTPVVAFVADWRRAR